MSERRLGPILSLLRQGLELDLEFGTRSLESLLRIAEIVEESVYVPGSLRATSDGVAFVLGNPPLRLGAFLSVRLHVNGTELGAEDVRFRAVGDPTWRSAAEVDRDRPLVLRPGEPVEFAGRIAPPPHGEARIRLDLQSVAIPPRVWFEFRERVRADGGEP